MLAVLAVAFTLWAAQDLILPVLLAMFLAWSATRSSACCGARCRASSARCWCFAMGIAGSVLLAQQLVQPAGEWIRRAAARNRPARAEAAQPGQTGAGREQGRGEHRPRRRRREHVKPVQVVKTEVNDPYKALTATPRMVASVLAVVLLTFFFMVYGQDLQRNAIALLPGRQQKKLTVEILQAIESEISRYVLTISIINVLLGLAYAACLYFFLALPLDEALLWGTMAAILNFAPYVGPLIGMVAMLAMGFLTYQPWQSLAPAAIYLDLHTLEGQLVTPIVLGTAHGAVAAAADPRADGVPAGCGASSACCWRCRCWCA